MNPTEVLESVAQLLDIAGIYHAQSGFDMELPVDTATATATDTFWGQTEPIDTFVEPEVLKESLTAAIRKVADEIKDKRTKLGPHNILAIHGDFGKPSKAVVRAEIVDGISIMIRYPLDRDLRYSIVSYTFRTAPKSTK